MNTLLKNLDLKLIILAILLALGIIQSSCVPARMALSDDIKTTAIEMPVYGRQGWRLNQNMSFGNYQVYNVQRGWMTGHDINIFFYNTAGMKQKFEFTIADADSNVWLVSSIAKIKSKEFKLYSGPKEIFNPNKYEEIMISTLQSEKYGTWRLIMSDKASWSETRHFQGILSNEHTHLGIRPVNRLQGGKIPLDHYTGIEFVLGDKTIGAVELINNGRVYLPPNLNAELKMALAGASAYLLLADNIKAELDKMQTVLHN
jgi:hypothetical protein